MTQEPIPGASGNAGAAVERKSPPSPPQEEQDIQPGEAKAFSRMDVRKGISGFFRQKKSQPESPPSPSHKSAEEQMLRMSRRTFTKALIYSYLATKVPGFLQLLDDSAPAITGNVYDFDQIDSEVPPSLILGEGEKIPTENDFFRPADAIFRDGLEQYQMLQSMGTAPMRPLHYTEPANYLTTEDVAGIIGHDITSDPVSLLGGMSTILDDANGIQYKNDRPYLEYFNGSGANITGPEQLIVVDPGTGIVRSIRESMKAQFSKDGTDFDVWDACNKYQYSHDDHDLTPEQRTAIRDQLKGWYDRAMEQVQGERRRVGGPISTSVLFAHFLGQNNGDILASVWDTSTWLKILARNNTDDPSKDYLKFDPTYQRAQDTTNLFRDEFSKTVSANWVVDHVSPTDSVLNKVDINNPYIQPEYKDYMPPNRAGGLYHAWNIMALSLCMDEPLVTRMVAMHVNPYLIDGKRFTEYGRVKSEADMDVVHKAGQIADMVRPYTSSSPAQ